MERWNQYETKDAWGRAIIAAGLGGSMVLLLLLAATKYYFHYKRDQHEISETLPRREHSDVVKKGFNDPRLQISPRLDFEQYKKQQLQHLHGFGWIDRSQGIVHVPIDVAMTRVAENNDE